MATGLGETLHRSPRNAESFLIKRRAFRLVPPDDGLFVARWLGKWGSSGPPVVLALHKLLASVAAENVVLAPVVIFRCSGCTIVSLCFYALHKWLVSVMHERFLNK